MELISLPLACNIRFYYPSAGIAASMQDLGFEKIITSLCISGTKSDCIYTLFAGVFGN
jgi:hypothetical protein